MEHVNRIHDISGQRVSGEDFSASRFELLASRIPFEP